MTCVYSCNSRSGPLGAARVGRRFLLRRLAVGLGVGSALALAGPARALAQAFQPFWVQSHRVTELWSGPDAGAVSFGAVPQWSYLQVVALQTGPRLRVRTRDGHDGYVDAAAVGPAGAPPSEAPARSPGYWVANHVPATLWSGADGEALPLGEVDQWNVFEVQDAAGHRLRLRDPRTGGHTYLDATAVGRIEPPGGTLGPPGQWWGSTGSAINVRATPTTDGSLRGEVGPRLPVVVQRWVSGQEVLPDQPTWAQLADDVFVYSALLRPAPLDQPPPLPADAPLPGRWIDVNLTHQVAVAYEGAEPIYVARLSSGRPGWETSTGVFRIFRRVANEVMDSSTLLGRDAARASYRVENIRWTQYFTSDGQALHQNYWRDPALFGMPSSHGCLGMLEPDARFFWDFAATGTPLVIHG